MAVYSPLVARCADSERVAAAATQVTILRNLKTKTMSCPCGSYSHLNAAVVRSHALKNHKGSDKVPRGSSPAASSSVAEQSAPSSPGPIELLPAPSARNKSSTRMITCCNTVVVDVDSLFAGPTAPPTHVRPQAELPSTSLPIVPVKRISDVPDFMPLKTGRKSLPSAPLSTPVVSTSNPRQSAQKSASVAGSSTKARNSSDAQPVSAWRERLLESMKKPSDSKNKNASPSRPLPAPFAPAAGSGFQVSKRVREEEAEPGRPAKAPRVESGFHSWRDIIMPMTLTQQLSRPKQVAKNSGRQPNALFRDLTPEEVETPDFECEDDEPASGQPEAEPPTLSEHKCTVCLQSVKTYLKYWKNQPEFVCSKCILKRAAAAKIKAPVSSNAEPSTSHTPVVAPSPASATPRPKPRPRPRVKRSDIASVPTEPKQLAAAEHPVQQPAVSYPGRPVHPRRAVVDPPSPVAGTSSEPEGLAHPFEAPSDSEAEPQPVPEKPKRRRVTKKMRAGAFRGWFDGVLADLHAKQAAGDTASALVIDRNDYLKVRLIEQHGGTAYTTQDEFLAALRHCIVAFERGKAEGRRERLAFRAGYSIVAQPKIKHKERGESVMHLLRAMGLT